MVIHIKNIIYAENHFGREWMFSEVTFNTRPRQNVNCALYANNIYSFTNYINVLCYNNQEDLVIGIVEDTSLCNKRQDFTSNKQLESGR